jgi:cysteine desulfurase
MTRELGRIGNASSSHSSGRAARRVVEEAREAIAAQVGAHPTELIFTSGGTEADNLAVKGGYWSQVGGGRTEIAISAIEHHAVSESVAWLATAAGATAVQLPVDATGRLDLAALESAVTTRTAVVSVMWANNEIGTVQPVAEVAGIAAERGALSHSDAVQAVGHIEFDFGRSGLDLASFTAHKLGGPYGVGALLARREVGLTAVQHGGGQERDVRSGTLDVAAIAAFAAAVQAAVGRREQEEVRLRALRSQLIDSVHSCVPDAVLYGSTEPARSLPGVTLMGFPGCQAESLLLVLDASGIDCSAGSACSAGVTQPSHVLSGIGATEAEARSVLRFSLGHTSSPADVRALAAALPEAVSRARAAAAYA